MNDKLSFKHISNQDDSKLASELISELLKSKEGFELFGKYLNSIFSGVDMTNISKIENIYCKHIKENTGEIDMIYDKDLEKELSEKVDYELHYSEDNTVMVVYGYAGKGKSLFLKLLSEKKPLTLLNARFCTDGCIKRKVNSMGGIILDEAEDFVERNKGKKIEGGFYALSLRAPTAEKDTHNLLKTMKKVQDIFGQDRMRIIHLE